MAYFSLPGVMQQEHGDAMQGYNKEEKEIFNKLFKTFLLTHQREIESKDWVDLLGIIYEILAGRFKRSSLGQFFTPSPVVDMIVKMQQTKDLEGKGIKINDPACGSGRFLIAFHANAPGNYVFGEDLDYICCKMACINLMLHGCEGQVIWHDSLSPKDFRKGWKINPIIRKYGIPSIVPITFEESFLNTRKPEMTTRGEGNGKLSNQQQEKVKSMGLQLNIF